MHLHHIYAHVYAYILRALTHISHVFQSVCPGLIFIFCNCSCPLVDIQNQSSLGVMIPTRHRLSRLSSTNQNWLGRIACTAGLDVQYELTKH